jgi:hypothetical protein
VFDAIVRLRAGESQLQVREEPRLRSAPAGARRRRKTRALLNGNRRVPRPHHKDFQRRESIVPLRPLPGILRPDPRTMRLKIGNWGRRCDRVSSGSFSLMPGIRGTLAIRRPDPRNFRGREGPSLRALSADQTGRRQERRAKPMKASEFCTPVYNSRSLPIEYQSSPGKDAAPTILSAADSGGPGQIRTADLSLRRRPLYPTELRARSVSIVSSQAPVSDVFPVMHPVKSNLLDPCVRSFHAGCEIRPGSRDSKHAPTRC